MASCSYLQHTSSLHVGIEEPCHVDLHGDGGIAQMLQVLVGRHLSSMEAPGTLLEGYANNSKAGHSTPPCWSNVAECYIANTTTLRGSREMLQGTYQLFLGRLEAILQHGDGLVIIILQHDVRLQLYRQRVCSDKLATSQIYVLSMYYLLCSRYPKYTRRYTMMQDATHPEPQADFARTFYCRLGIDSVRKAIVGGQGFLCPLGSQEH